MTPTTDNGPVAGARANIAALQTAHDQLVGIAGSLVESDVTKMSGATEWTVAQVFSHLGSGAEIGLATLTTGATEMAAMQAVWARWNAMAPTEQVDSFVEAHARHLDALVALDDDTLATKTVDLGFLPFPADMALLTRLRLSEVALHHWDIAVALDRQAAVGSYAVAPLLEGLPMLAGMLGRPIGGDHAVTLRTTDPDREFRLSLTDEGARLEPSAGEAPADTVVVLPGEALLRLTSGRLRAEHTPATVQLSGPLTLEDLRRVFPGY